MSNSRDWIPSTDAGLLAFATNLSTKVSAQMEHYGQPESVAIELAARLSTYATALATATDPLTRGPHATLLKNEARASLVQYCRLVGQAITRTISVTDAQRDELGLPIYDREPTPTPVPSEPPLVSIVKVEANRVTILAQDAENPTRRGRPPYVTCLTVMSHVGEAQPTAESNWHFMTNSTRTKLEIEFAPELPLGTRVWIAAFWASPRLFSGPACEPISAVLMGTSVNMTA